MAEYVLTFPSTDAVMDTSNSTTVFAYLLGLSLPANRSARLKYAEVHFYGTSATDPQARIEVCEFDNTGTATGSANLQLVNGLSNNSGITSGYKYTAAPTTLQRMVWNGTSHGQSFWFLPRQDRGIDVGGQGSARLLVLRCQMNAAMKHDALMVLDI